jgi:hypoxanthine phosphoribosyltransferase
MNLPFTVVGVSSYNDDTNEQETLVCNTPDILFENWGGSILICDDIADSGRTLEFLADKISTYPQIKRFTTVTLYYKAHSVFIPDFYVIETNKWVVFPWEQK